MSTPGSRTILHMNIKADTAAERAYLAPQAAAVAARATAATQITAHPSYDVHYQGGKTIPNLVFTLFYVGGEAAWTNSDRTNIDHAIAAAMSDRRLNNVMGQYFSTPITSTFRPSTVLTGSPPTTVSQSDAEGIITGLYNGGQLNGYDFGSSVFGLILPSKTVLTDDTSSGNAGVRNARVAGVDTAVSSLDGLGGYHGSVSVGGKTLYYAIVVYAEDLGGGKQNGIVAFDQPWKNVNAALYHELNESRTDPDVYGTPGWVSNPISDFGGQSVEVGDAPVFEAGNNLSLVFQDVPLADGSGTVPIQLMWSDAVHGPEGPRDTPDPAAPTTGGGVGGGSPVVIIIGIVVALLLILGIGFIATHR